MPIFLSQTSETLKQKAEQLSYRLGHYYLGCEHIFLAIMDDSGWLSGILLDNGLNPEEIRQEIIDTCGPGDEEQLWNGIITTPRLGRVLKQAERIAEKQRSSKVEPNHIVSAILREQKSVPSRALSSLGGDLYALREAVLPAGGVSAENKPVKPGTPVNYPVGAPYGAFLAGKMQGKQDEKGIEAEARRREEQKKASRKVKTPTLDKLGRDLVELARCGKTEPLVGRKEEIRRVLQTLSKKMKNNPIIIGEPGVGKTAVVYALAQRIAEGKVPSVMKDKTILEIGMSGIIAGTKHRGEFEERMQNIINELVANPDIILFIDEIHTIMGAGESRSGVDAGNILKPYLARGDITIIGATTIDEYRRYLEKDPALERRFQPVLVDEPSEEDTLEILKGLKEKYEKHHGVKFTEKAIVQAVKLSVRYLPDRNLPDKAIDLMDESAAKHSISYLSFSDEQMKDLEKKAESAQITENDIAEVVSLWTGIPANTLSQDESERLMAMEENMQKRVVGQDEAVKTVAQTVRMVRMGLSSPNRPSGVFLFLGPTGVGKTEVAKALAEFLFGSEKDLIRLDMSEYMEKHSISRLIGSPPGYVGHDEEGQLTRAVRTRPYSVVLLDEVEKAHPDVYDLFLQVFDDGRLTDSKGRTINFTNTIIIMTSNIGSSNVGKSGELMTLDTRNPEVRERIMGELRKHFRPEFINRIDEIVIFNSLNEKALNNIVQINLRKLMDQLYEQKEVELEIRSDAVKFLLKEGFDPAYGARPLKRAIQSYLSKPLAEAMLSSGVKAGDTLVVTSDGEKLVFRKKGAGTSGESADSYTVPNRNMEIGRNGSDTLRTRGEGNATSFNGNNRGNGNNPDTPSGDMFDTMKR